MTDKNPVSKDNLKRFAYLNEVMFEATAGAESKAFAKFSDLTLLQIQVIRLIEFHRPCTMSKLAKSMTISLASVTQLIDRLVKKGYVQRARSVRDRRQIFAQLTEKGKTVTAASRKHIRTVGVQMLENFTSDEQVFILDVIEKMGGN